FVPATQEECRHLIGRRHFTEIDGILVDPHEAARGRSHYCFWFAFSDANADTIRQDTADDRSAHPRQSLEVLTERREICAPNSRLTNVSPHNRFNVIERSARSATRLNRTNLEEARRCSRTICDDDDRGDDCNHGDPQCERYVAEQRFETRATSGLLSRARTALAYPTSIANLLHHDWLSQGSLPL